MLRLSNSSPCLTRSGAQYGREKMDNIWQEVNALRVIITLACTESGDRNYTTTKNKRTTPERLEVKKYSPRLKRVTVHRETR
ncbi:hypothetical protein PAEN110709_20030 [Paenibacillus endophyticus]